LKKVGGVVKMAYVVGGLDENEGGGGLCEKTLLV